jgi:hydrogenase nickel incorporation protein HypB
MCATCGCSGADHHHDHDHGHAHHHDHDDGHDHAHHHDHGDGHDAHHHDHGDGHDAHHRDHDDGHDEQARTVALERDLLARNDRLAAANRAALTDRGITMLNLMSSPGAGKTTLLERAIRRLAPGRPVAVIEGDQETDNDAARIRSTGAPVVQINTGAGCHLDAAMVRRGLDRLDPPDGSLVLVENVGNLVCPSLFDLGEQARVVIMAVTEGEDKPLKYPHMFRAADVLVLNKIDLLPYLEVDLERCLGYVQRVRPPLPVFRVSATRGDGLDDWCGWIRRQCGVPAPAGEPREGTAWDARR